MSFRYQEIVWDVPQEDVQVGIAVGYEVELSLEPFFNKTSYILTTNEEIKGVIAGEFFYSLDDGITWIDFPLGEQGKVFNSAYKMKVVVNAGELSDVFAEKNGTIYKIYAQGRNVVESYQIGTFEETSLGVDERSNDLYITGQDKTAYKLNTSPILKAADNSINLITEPLGVLVDGTRDSMWQVNSDNVCLKDLEGNEVFCVDIPNIDVDYSSSSSSSIDSSSSSSVDSSSSSSSQSDAYFCCEDRDVHSVDLNAHFSSWNILGATTDVLPDCRLWVVAVTFIGDQIVRLYDTPTADVLLANVTQTLGSPGTLTFVEQSGSGITGTVEWDGVGVFQSITELFCTVSSSSSSSV